MTVNYHYQRVSHLFPSSNMQLSVYATSRRSCKNELFVAQRSR